jgi:nucleoside-diphosphate-sugar epimerase
VFNVSDDDNQFNNYKDTESILMNHFGVPNYPLPILKIPMCILSFLLTRLGRDNTNPSRVYSIKKISSIGYKKAVTYENGLHEFAQWYVATHNKFQ